ncbi:MAG TPA: histidine kinase [Bacteroidales bacterium]|nr:histidine kinase [Bacteroidales bacterium]
MRKVTREATINVILHVLAWIIILVLPVFAARKFRMGSNFLFTYYAFMAINAFIFYANYLLLVPLLFLRKKRHMYYIAVASLVFCFYFISDFANGHLNELLLRNYPEQFNMQQDDRPGPPQRRPRIRPVFFISIPNAHLIGYASSSVLMVFLSLGLRVLERQSKIEKMQEETERSKLHAELAFLKNQISPHFFFNTLNNIYSLIDRSNEDSKNAVIKLSKLMRYVLNESDQDYRLLGDEIEFMNNYIDLMKLRIGSKTKLNVSFPAEYRNFKIPHLLFISLIENAFKYGISVQEESFVNISLLCGEQNIIFKCENGLPVSNNGTIIASSGIGLENLKKRLSLLYPGRHELVISKTKNKFEVTLIIQSR